MGSCVGALPTALTPPHDCAYSIIFGYLCESLASNLWFLSILLRLTSRSQALGMTMHVYYLVNYRVKLVLTVLMRI